MKHAVMLALGAVCIAAAPAAGQTIAQGMTPDQVRSEFGAPATARAAGDWTYWYYHNGCPRRCGSDDVVFFQNDRVVAAVLRTSRRRYQGPDADNALRATDDGTSSLDAGGPRAGTVIVGGVRVEGAQPNDGGGVIVIPAADAEGTPVRAREGRPGEAPTIVIGGGDPEPGSVAAPVTAAETGIPANRPAVDATELPPTTPADDIEPAAPAENVEATDLDGRTSIDRKNDRIRRDRSNETTATERARENDRRGNP